MAFEAGAMVARMKLDRSEFTAGMTAVKAEARRASQEVRSEMSRSVAATDIRKQFAQLRTDLNRFKETAADVTRGGARGSDLFGASLTRLTRNVAAVVAAHLSLRAVIGVYRDGVQAVEDFEQQVIGLAATLTSLDTNTGPQNVAERFKMAKEFAREAIAEIEKLDSRFSGTGQELTKIYRALIEQGVLVNTQVAEQREGFLAMAEALKVATRGMNFDTQVTDEIRGLLTGERENTKQLARFLGLAGEEADKLRARLSAAKDSSEKAAILMGVMRERAQGFVVASGDMSKTLTGVTSSLQSTWAIISRKAFAGVWEDIVWSVNRVNSLLRDSSGNLTSLSHQIIDGIKGGWELVKSAAQAAWNIMTDPAVSQSLDIIAAGVRAIGWALAPIPRALQIVTDALRPMIEMLRVAISGWSTLINLMPGGRMSDQAIEAQAAELRSGDELRRRFPYRPPAVRDFNLRGASGGGGGGGRRARGSTANTALQRALSRLDIDVDARDLTPQQQIARLQQIRAAFAKTVDERLDLERRIVSLRKQIRQEEARARKEEFDDSLRFIQQRIIAEKGSHEEVLSAYRRVIERVKATRAADLGGEKEKAEVLKRIESDLSDYRIEANREAAEKIRDMRRDLTEEIERLTLDEFEVERRAIARRFDEQAKEIRSRMSRDPVGARAALSAAGQARDLAIGDVNRRERISDAERAVRLAQVQLDLKRGTIEQTIIAKEALVELLRTEQSAEVNAKRRLEIVEQLRAAELDLFNTRKEAKDLQIDAARTAVEIADAEQDIVNTQTRQVRVTQAQVDARRRVMDMLPKTIEYERERLGLAREIIDLERQMLEQRAATDPIAGLRLAIEESRDAAFSWVDAWRSAVDGVRNGIEGFFGDLVTGTKGVVDSVLGLLANLARQVYDVFARAVSDELTKWVTNQVSALIPGFGGGNAATGAAGLTAAGGILAGAGNLLNVAAQQLIVAANSLAIGGGGGVGGGGGFLSGIVGGVLGLAKGGQITGGRIALAGSGLYATGPILAAIAERPGMREVVQPLPRGMTARDLADTYTAVREMRQAPAVEGPINLTYTGDLHFPNVAASRAHARIVADQIRLARRGNHPAWRDGR